MAEKRQLSSPALSPGSVYRHPRKFHVLVVQNNGKEMHKKV